jgi:predicted TPR repeat methyltransferase
MEHVFDEVWIRQKQFKYAMENEIIYQPSTDIDHKVIDAQLPAFIKGATGEDEKKFILDIGCGDGYAMEKMIDLGYENVQGITLHKQEFDICKGKELSVHLMNYNFSQMMDRFFHAIWARQSLQFSFQPFFTMLEFNRILRINGWIYIEVPDISNNGVPLGTLHSETYARLFNAAGFEIVQSDSITLSSGDLSETHNFFALVKRKNVNLPALPEEE